VIHTEPRSDTPSFRLGDLVNKIRVPSIAPDLPPRRAPFIAFVGAKQSGKDTAANFLVSKLGYTRLAFADRLKELLYEANPMVTKSGYRLRGIVDQVGWDDAKESYPEVRQALQRVGLACRIHIGDTVWVDIVAEQVRDLRAEGKAVVLTDVRFPNEVEMVRELGGALVRVIRHGQELGTDDHISETALADVPVDDELWNPGKMDAYTWAITDMHGRHAW